MPVPRTIFVLKRSIINLQVLGDLGLFISFGTVRFLAKKSISVHKRSTLRATLSEKNHHFNITFSKLCDLLRFV